MTDNLEQTLGTSEDNCNPKAGQRLDFDYPGHFICAENCRYVKHTHIGQWCISTVGEYVPDRSEHMIAAGFPEYDGKTVKTIGLDRTYETMVFPWDPTARDGKGETADWSDVDMLPANDAIAAESNHEALVDKWRDRKWKWSKDANGIDTVMPDGWEPEW